MRKLGVFHVWVGHYWSLLIFNLNVLFKGAHWHGLCLRQLPYSVTISGSCRARLSMSPTVIVFLQVCLLTGVRLCLTELLQPVRPGLCPAVRQHAHQRTQDQTFSVDKAAKHHLLFVIIFTFSLFFCSFDIFRLVFLILDVELIQAQLPKVISRVNPSSMAVCH